MNRRRCRGGEPGLTLVELLVVMSIVGIVLLFGIPSFENLVASNARSAVVNALIMHLQLARSEAIKQAREVTVCASSSAGVCDGAANEWGRGYVVVPGRRADGFGNVIRRVSDSGRILIDGGTAIRIGYASDGTLSAVNDDHPEAPVVFVVCDSGGAAKASAVVFSFVGAPTVRHPTSSQVAAAGCPPEPRK
jgi:type IV fimbrial biogenesis protein FimT